MSTIRTRSRSQGRGDSNLDSDPSTGVTRRGSRYSIADHDPGSPVRQASRHSESSKESDSGLKDDSVQRSGQLPFPKNLIVIVRQTLGIFGKKIQVILGGLLELILNCLINLVFQVRRICRFISDQYDRRDALFDVRQASRHSESGKEYKRSVSGLEDESVQRSGQLSFLENLIVNVNQTLGIFGKKIQVILGGLLELVLNCLVNLVIHVRGICRLTSDQYDRRDARIDVESFLWVGFWSLIVTLFFVPPNSDANVIKRVARFAVSTFQTTGLLYVLFFMLYLYKKIH